MTKLRIALVSFLVFLGIVAADVNFNESRAVLKAVASASFANATLSNPTFTGTVTASQVTGIPIVLAKWGVPVILASSGTMGNNGAVSGMTALPTTYSGGAWLYLPADAISAGSAAGFYWFVGSSTTAGTVYNSTFDGSTIPPAGTTTAFVTTGPGAFTGVSSGEIVAATITVPANAIGPNGAVVSEGLTWEYNTAAGNKLIKVRYSGAAGTQLHAATVSTSSPSIISLKMQNLGAANRQRTVIHSATNASAGVVYTSQDSTASATIVFSLEKATATNHVILGPGTFSLIYGS